MKLQGFEALSRCRNFNWGQTVWSDGKQADGYFVPLLKTGGDGENEKERNKNDLPYPCRAFVPVSSCAAFDDRDSAGGSDRGTGPAASAAENMLTRPEHRNSWM